MRYCRECGIPWQFGWFLRWTPDGAILGRDVARTRLVFLEVDEVRSLFAGVSERTGMPVDRFVYAAEKEVGRRFASTLLPRFLTMIPRTRVTRPQWLAKLIGRLILRYMAGLGMGRGRIISYRSGRSGAFRLEGTHYVPLVAGDSAGVFEHLERVGADASWEEVSPGRFVVEVEKTGDSPPSERSLFLEKAVFLPGNLRFEYCPGCGVPLEVSRNLSWDELDRGFLRNRTTGVREVALGAQSFFAVFRELERELGGEIPALVENLEQEYMRESSGRRRYLEEKTDVMDLMSDFGWRGMGNPVRAEKTSFGLEVTIENPFHPGMVAGRVAGLYEAAMEKRVRATWSFDTPGRLKVTIGGAP